QRQAARALCRGGQLHPDRPRLCRDDAERGGHSRRRAHSCGRQGMSDRKTAVVVCPGRGTYNKAELGYLGRHFPDAALLAAFDAQRPAAGQDTLAALDGAERFSLAQHTRGDNASGLIYAATLGDFLAIDRERIEVVAVTGNSMGWYSALACAGAVSAEVGFT